MVKGKLWNSSASIHYKEDKTMHLQPSFLTARQRRLDTARCL